MHHSGHATPDGTRAFRDRFAGRLSPDHFREWQGLFLSSIGLGTYLGAHDDATDRLYEAAIRRAVLSGVNHLDSAINYRFQRSERAIGRALSGLFAEGALRREEILVATKGGFIPFDGGPPDDPVGYFEATYVRPGLLGPEDVVAGCHSLSPGFLELTLGASLANLGLDTVDVYYLHNPEIQLTEVGRPEFLARMTTAFALLERMVEAGRIRIYGTATWDGYRKSPEARDHLSLEELLQAAREAGGDAHHFRAIQLPYSLAMPEAYVSPSQEHDGGRLPLLAAAARHGMLVSSSASIYQSHLTRGLPAFLAQRLPGLATDAQRAIQFARSTPGLTTALVGMKREEHVEENLGAAKVARADEETIRSLFGPGG